MVKPLSQKQLSFISEYCIDRNATRACMRAGYSQNVKVAEVTGFRLLRNPKIKAELDLQIVAIAKRNEVSIDRVIQELARIGTVDIRDAFDEKGNLKPIHEIPEDVARAIAGIEVDDIFEMQSVGNRGRRKKVHIGYTKKLRLTEKTKALELIGRHLKMFDGEKAPEQHLHLHFEDKKNSDLYSEIMSQLTARRKQESGIPGKSPS